jgi:hypothetical protein
MAMAEMHNGSGDRIFKATLVVLLFFFNLLHWGMFIGCRLDNSAFKTRVKT